MGNATVCLSDAWSVLNNVAGITGTKAVTAALSYDAFPVMPAFAKAGIAITLPGTVACAAGFYRFGDDVYSEHVATLGAATKWKHTALGLTVNNIRYAVDGMGSKSAFTVSFGGLSQLAEWITVGAHIANINQPWLSVPSDERLPTVLTAGLLFTLAPEVLVTTAVEKRINDRATGSAGLEFAVYKKFITRLGMQVNPQALSGGLGFSLRYMTADYSILYIPVFGTRHQLSIRFTWERLNRTKSSTSKPPTL